MSSLETGCSAARHVQKSSARLSEVVGLCQLLRNAKSGCNEHKSAQSKKIGSSLAIWL